jgi:arsenite-transporting ATPase
LDLDWPGLDEVMGLLEIQRLLTEKVVDRVVVDMAPSGHTLNLLGIKDFLDIVLNSLELFKKNIGSLPKLLSEVIPPMKLMTFWSR